MQAYLHASKNTHARTHIHTHTPMLHAYMHGCIHIRSYKIAFTRTQRCAHPEKLTGRYSSGVKGVHQGDLELLKVFFAYTNTTHTHSHMSNGCDGHTIKV